MNKEEKIKKKISNKLLEKRKQVSGNKNLKNQSSGFEDIQKLQENEKDKTQEVSLKERISSRMLKGEIKQENNKDALTLMNKELSSLNEKLKQSLNDNLYLRAEFENFKRCSAEEKRQLTRYSGEQFIFSLANEVLDDLDRAIFSAQEEQSFENLKKGLEMIQKKLSQVLHSFGVEILDPTGTAFDPSYQEALSHVKTSKFPEGHVAETFKKAYKLHDKVIRPAQVILAKKEESN